MIKYMKINGFAKVSNAQWKERAFNAFTYALVGFVILSGLSLLIDWSENGNEKRYAQRFSPDLNKVRKIILENDADETQIRDVNCTFWNCVDIYRCGQNRLAVYVYPLQMFVSKTDKGSIVLTREYYEILETVYQSPYYTANPNEACLFLPSIDLLNQQLFNQKLVNRALASLEYWDRGANHLIFNMLPGNFDDFNRSIDVNTDRAIILGGGFDTWTYRAGFDISFPVWSPMLQHFDQTKIEIDFQRKYLLVVGQLNMLPQQLHAVQNIAQEYPNEVILLKSCKTSDHSEIELNCKEYVGKGMQHKYPQLLASGTFCLIGRSVRLGQPDLLEILAHNCIPVIAIDNYILPFEDVIDWNLAAIRMRESDTHGLMAQLKSVSAVKILELQQQGRWLFNRYFRDLRTITLTALELLDGRMFPHRARNLRQWNTADINYKIPLNPLFLPIIAPKTQGFTAVILTYDRVESLFTLIQKLSLVPSLQCILVIWNNQHKSPPHISTFPMIMKPIKVIQTHANKLSNRFFPYAEIETEAILTIDDDINMLTADELDFGFEVWREFPDRIVGFPSRIHIWDNITMRWHYESEWTNQISMVLTGAAFHHKFWSHMYTHAMPGDIKDWVDERMNCEDIAMNFLVANITNKPPIKVTPRKKFKCPECINNEMLSADLNHMRERSACIDRFARIYGHMPLRSVEFRADPVLFKDNFPEKLKRFNDVGAL